MKGSKKVAVYYQRDLRRIVKEDEGEPLVDIPQRPRTRGECEEGPRPCPWISCKYHLYASITPDGDLIIHHPTKEPDELEHTCTLDLAEDRDGMTLEEVGVVLNYTRERVRQLENRALSQVSQRDLTGIVDR